MTCTPANASSASATDNRHWAFDYLGKPYLVAAHGPTHYDCWGLVWHFHKNRLGIDIPWYPECQGMSRGEAVKLIDGAAREQIGSGAWTEIAVPFDGCTVMLARNKVFSHCGVYAQDNMVGRIVHASPGGVMAQDLKSMRAHGWSVIRYYRHKEQQT
jgi:cell wall-associated NlpC family hydrolase